MQLPTNDEASLLYNLLLITYYIYIGTYYSHTY